MRDTMLNWDSLTFSFSELTPVPVFSFICTIYVITKIFYIYIIHTTIVAFIIFYTHILESLYLYYYNFTITKLYIYLSNENQRLRNSAVSTYHRSGIHVLYIESHYFSIYKTYTYSKIQRLRKQCGEHLSLSWPALLMWDVMSSILVFCFCTYMD